MRRSGSLGIALFLILVGVVFLSGLLAAIVTLVIQLTGIALIAGGVIMAIVALTRGGRRRSF